MTRGRVTGAFAMPYPQNPRGAKGVRQQMLLLLEAAPGPVSLHLIAKEIGCTDMAVRNQLTWTKGFDYFAENLYPCERCERDERWLYLTDKGIEAALVLKDRLEDQA